MAPDPARRPAADGGTPDQVFVRDYLVKAEIGAFEAERGVEQRLRFTVVLDVAPPEVEVGDDVANVVGYDRIVQVIGEVLAERRFNLLETLAERVAARCLEPEAVIAARVRIEKIDRIDGALGVEILRRRG